MRRILQGILGILLANGVLGLTRPAAAQAPISPITPAPTENGQPAPKPIPPCSSDTWDSELRLPTIVPAKPQPAPSGKKARDAKTMKPPAPLTKWGESAMSWESQVKKKPETTPAVTGEALKAPIVKPAMPDRATEPEAKPATKSKPTSFASEHQPVSSGSDSASASSPALTVPTTPRRWQRTVTSEESEPRAEPSTKLTKPTKTPTHPAAVPAPVVWTKSETPPAAVPAPIIRTESGRPPAAVLVPITRTESERPPAAVAAPIMPIMPIMRTESETPPAAAPAPVVQPATTGGSPNSGRVMTSATPPGAPLDRPFRWPPAYDVRPPEPKSGRPGVITFEDEPDPKPDPKSAMMANLKQQVQLVCGKQARDVFVEGQRDGSVLVKVKVANPSNEDRLTRKILTIPEMASSKVRLTMDISP